MEVIEHKKKFDEIVRKYKLFEEKKAEEISIFLTKSKVVSRGEFATLFNMDINDADIFLSFIHKGIIFKEQNIDNKN
jgi:predicted HTH domain antitoxin